MKKNILYTVNKWNQPMLAEDISSRNYTPARNNLFWTGGGLFNNTNVLPLFGSYPSGITQQDKDRLRFLIESNQSALRQPVLRGWDALAAKDKSRNPWNYADDLSATDQYKQSRGGLFNMAKATNPFSKGNIGSTASGIASAASPFVTGLISDGYSTGGVGEGVSTVTNAIGSAVGGPWGAVITGAGAVVGGAINRVGGIKENKKNISTIEQNTATAKNVGSELAGVNTNEALLDVAGNMVTGTGFGTKDLYKGGLAGFAKRKARKKGQKLLNKENSALAYQTQGLITGAENADRTQDDMVLGESYAFGGPLGYAGDMGAIEYGLLSDYLAAKNRQIDTKDKITAVPMNSYANGGKLFALGGDGDGVTDWAHYKGRVVPYSARINSERGRGSMKEAGFTDAEIDDWYSQMGRNPGTFGGGAYGEGGAGGRWNPPYVPKNTKSFNAAFDEARQAGAEDFLFGGKRYTTVKEANPVREYNNRYVGAGRTEEQIRKREGYGKDYGPIGGKFSLMPVIPYAEGGNIEIKHPGRLTALKERTGKSEAELWAEGRPEVRKMITFARNARKWKHAEGGPLETVVTQQYAQPDFFGTAGNETLFALGGDIQTNSADFTTGLTHIDAGGSHEMNPNQGVQVGVDREGNPNLVEEGEAIFNDYVYSARIQCDPETKKKFHIGKKQDITYADLAKKLEKEASERPNDPISQAGLQAQMADLAQEQERQKAEMEAARARKAFEALSPEEQAAIMQRVAQEEQMQQQAMAEQAAMAQQPEQQISPEEAAAMEQQMMAQQEMTPQGQVPVMGACGGKINKYPGGGPMAVRNKLLGALGVHTWDDLVEWAVANKVGDKDYWGNQDENSVDWSELARNENVLKYLKEKSPTLAHSIEVGDNNLGEFVPDATNPVSIQSINVGNWDTSGSGNNLDKFWKGWENSEDDMWKEAIAKNLINKNMKLSDIEKGLMATDAWKNTTKYLKESPEHMLAYLQAVKDDPNAPASALRHLEKFTEVDSDTGKLKWKAGIDPTYDTVLGTVRHTYPGTYWHSIKQNPRNAKIMNFVKNKNGEWKPVLGDVDTSWKKVDTQSWQTPDSDISYVYYDTPETAKAAGASPDGEGADAANWVATPNYRNENLRYAGFFGPAFGLGMQALGIGRPNTSGLTSAFDLAKTTGRRYATPSFISGYYKYKPEDLFFDEIAAAGENARAIRAGTNAAIPIGSKQAFTLAADKNYQDAVGKRRRESQMYNNNERLTSLHEQKDTDKWNAGVRNEFAQFNAQRGDRNAQFQAQLAADIAKQKLDANAGWYNGIYGNVAGLFKGISDLGRENAQHNMIAEMAADEIFGTISPRTNTGKKGKYLTFTKRNAACGGKMNRKKGGK